MNGNTKRPSSTDQLQATLGRQFTFTEDDLSLLHMHLLKARTYFERRNVGWRVVFIREITHINRIIRGALDRAHEDPTDPGQLDLL